MMSGTTSERLSLEKLESVVDTKVYPVHERRIIRKMASLPANVLKDLAHTLSSLGKRRVLEQASVAALLPPELLIQIFEHLVESVPIEDLAWRSTGKTKRINCHLKNAALVCKAWHPIATILLYGNVTIPSQAVLKSFERLLRKSPEVKGRIRSFSYMTPGSGIQLLGHKRTHKDQQKVVNTCMRLDPSTSINLQLWEPCAKHFFERQSIDMSRLTGLHIVSTPFTLRESFISAVMLPNLQSLTIEFGCFMRFSDWPKLPQLKSLRLMDAMIFFDDKPVDCSAFANITKLELSHVFYQTETLLPLLQACASTLDHLMLVNLKGPDYPRILRELRNMSSLRTLIIGPRVFSKEEPLHLPPNLEELSIQDSVLPLDFLHLEVVDVADNCEGLREYLESGTILPDTLRKINARGSAYDWEENELSRITKLTELKGISFKYEELKVTDAVSTDRRVRWRTRFWQALKRRLRIRN